MRCHLVYVDSEDILVLYCFQFKKMLEEIVAMCYKSYKYEYPMTDAESAIGKCFEYSALPLFRNFSIELYTTDVVLATLNLVVIRSGYINCLA